MIKAKSKKGRTKEEFFVMTDLEIQSLKEGIIEQYKKKYNPSDIKLKDHEFAAGLDNAASLVAKAIGKGDTKAFNKIMNIAYGKPKRSAVNNRT